MKTKKSNPRLITANISRIVKSGRDSFSGIMRYAASRDDWNVRVARDGFYTTSNNDSGQDTRPDGIIGHLSFMRSLPTCQRRNVPIVTINSSSKSREFRIDAEVFVDDGAIGRAAAEIFLKAGLRNLAFVGVSQKSEAFHQTIRCKALRECAQDAGATFDAFLPNIDINTTQDLDELAAWLAALPTPCGVMAYNDSRAQTVFDACHMMHLKIPEQIQIVGVDNEVEICENMRPTLTSILPDFYGAGYLAAQILDDIFTNGRPRKTRKESYGIKAIIVRESTQDLKGGGRLVSLAREFIRLHVHERISVKDIAAALNVSRRTLEHRVKEVTGQGVAGILRKERLERVRQQLIETNRTITEIALDSGFTSPTHLAGLFKKTFGVTMGECRQQPPMPVNEQVSVHDSDNVHEVPDQMDAHAKRGRRAIL